jgi:hypothetical protein
MRVVERFPIIGEMGEVGRFVFNIGLGCEKIQYLLLWDILRE